MKVHNVSMRSLRETYGKSERDDAMIDAYLQRRHEASVKRQEKEGR